MKVSIATICLNQAPFIAEAMESVLAQRHPDLEYIVVDAGSTDGSREVVERYRDFIDHVIFEPDDGPADGLNKALRAATGEIWACLNADDLLLPGSVSAAAGAFERDPSLEVVYGDGCVVNEHGVGLRRERSDKFSARRYAYGIGTVVQQSTFIRRRAVLNVGGYNSSNRTCWDGELLLELALRGANMRHVGDVWGVFRVHSYSITGSQRVANEYEADRRRLFEHALGRPWQATDPAIVMAARLFKALKNVGKTRKASASAYMPPRLAATGMAE
jgi:glycosyltransferase involved in cell wall biosynthesis